MPLVPPELDDRTFEAILAEVRRKIPAYTPEWTDLNESDPGITLAQLFAFMTEHLLYQVDQVPEKGFITFLKMVGAELHPATPAVADVTLTNVRRPDTVPFRIIDRGTTVATASPNGTARTTSSPNSAASASEPPLTPPSISEAASLARWGERLPRKTSWPTAA